MKNITDSNIEIPCKSAVALGIFDGVHLGHRKIIEKAVSFKEKGLSPSVFTFAVESVETKHGKSFEYIYGEKFKHMIIEDLGAEYIFAPEIGSIRNLSGEDFAREILGKKMNAEVVVCGENFRFGKGAACGVYELKEYGESFGFEVCVCETECRDNSRISSETVRKLLKDGESLLAAELLAEPYCVWGEVVSGNRLGRLIDFPTINQEYKKGQLAPKYGVYRSETVINGKCYPSITNIGVKPTIEKLPKLLAETHILDFAGNLYGEKLPVKIYEFIRGEKRFSSIEELQNQISCDTALVRERSEKA